MNSTVFVIAGLVALVAGLAVFAASRLALKRGKTGWWLAGTVLVSAGLLALVAGWLMSEPNPNRGEALKTGGLAAGSVVALYALWLNDRRRRVEEDRQVIERSKQELEMARSDHDRERVADERFARSVELLGNDADQVRVGAMHALSNLARNRPYYTQTVLDVVCSYLRMPFDREAVDMRELQVRRTAQRVIEELLPEKGTPDPVRYNLDLTGADLEYFDISERVVGTLVLRFAKLHNSNSMWGSEILGSAWFTGATSHGILHAHHVVFHRKAWFSGFTADGPVNLSSSKFLGPTKFSGSTFSGKLDLSDSTLIDVETTDAVAAPESALPEGWEMAAEPIRDGLVRIGQVAR
ncbi:pentapeptide repeat-containing protein [Actinokineospora sp. HUAS TT18]|uniref:pentapeptide repeat-containing protein n=1 Tax=Actinokineospora sp. HUAS TT18 TaxID=3447451 RepID=UPI003F52388D